MNSELDTSIDMRTTMLAIQETVYDEHGILIQVLATMLLPNQQICCSEPLSSILLIHLHLFSCITYYMFPKSTKIFKVSQFAKENKVSFVFHVDRFCLSWKASLKMDSMPLMASTP